jgi:hypothetical protein
VVHVRDVHGAVRGGLQVDGTKEQIRAQDELGSRVGIAQLRQPFGLHRFRPPHETADGLTHQHVADQVRRQPVGPDHVDARARGEMVQHAERTERGPAACVSRRRQSADGFEARLGLVRQSWKRAALDQLKLTYPVPQPPRLPDLPSSS